MLKELEFQKLLDELSSQSAAPGGGSVAGIAGALSAAMLSMVCNLTFGKKKYQQHEDDVKKCLEKGLLINNATENTLRFLPSLTIKKKHVDEAIEILEEVL